MTIAECRELDTAILDHKRIYQGGMQRRNVDNIQVAATLARTGKLALSDPAILPGKMPPGMAGVDPSKHVRDFLDCVKCGARPPATQR